MSIQNQRSMSISQKTNRSDSKTTSSKCPLVRKHSYHHRFAFLTSIRERTVVHQSESIDKHEGRRRSMINKERRPIRFDEGSLHLFNDPSTTIYQRLNDSLQNKTQINSMINDEEEEKLKLCEKFANEDLIEFMKDRHGKIKSKFDKVFII